MDYFFFFSVSWAGTTCPKMMSSARETTWYPTTGSGKPSFRSVNLEDLYMCIMFEINTFFKFCYCSSRSMCTGPCKTEHNSCILFRWGFIRAMHSLTAVLCLRRMVTLSSTAGSPCGIQTQRDRMLCACACSQTATWSCTTRTTSRGGTQIPARSSATCAVSTWLTTALWWCRGKAKTFGPLLRPKAWSNDMQTKSFCTTVICTWISHLGVRLCNQWFWFVNLNSIKTFFRTGFFFPPSCFCVWMCEIW